jgi:hypothetical protein
MLLVKLARSEYIRTSPSPPPFAASPTRCGRGSRQPAATARNDHIFLLLLRYHIYIECTRNNKKRFVSYLIEAFLSIFRDLIQSLESALKGGKIAFTDAAARRQYLAGTATQCSVLRAY